MLLLSLQSSLERQVDIMKAQLALQQKEKLYEGVCSVEQPKFDLSFK